MDNPLYHIFRPKGLSILGKLVVLVLVSARIEQCNSAFSDTYNQARQRLRRAEDTSDLQSESDLGRGKRKKKTKRLQISEDEDEDYMQAPLPPRSMFRSIVIFSAS